MDVLIRKSDRAVLWQWNAPPQRIPHPEKPLGALTMGAGTARPLDFGPYILVETVDVKPTPGTDERLVGPTFSVGDGPDFVTTATWTVETTPRPTVISYNEFRARFTAEELPLVKAAVWADADALDLSMMASANNSVDLLGQTADDFLSAMVMAEAITPQRKTVILTP